MGETRASVTGVMPVQLPDPTRFARSLRSLDAQEGPLEELVIVDSSPETPVTLPEGLSTPITIIHRPELFDRGRTIPQQRRLGVQAADTPLIWRLDDDALFESPHHLETLMADLARPGVAAACSLARPLEPTPQGRLAAAMMEHVHPSYGLFPLYRREICPSGWACYPNDTTNPFSPSAEDIIFTRQLLRNGRIHRNGSLVARTSLPMTRERRIMQLLGAGGILSLTGIALGTAGLL